MDTIISCVFLALLGLQFASVNSSPSTSFKHDNNNYFIGLFETAWTEAKTFCTEKDGKLASRDVLTHSKTMKYLKQYGSVWTERGGVKVGAATKCPLIRYTGNPDCEESTQSNFYTFENVPCNENHRYICKLPQTYDPVKEAFAKMRKQNDPMKTGCSRQSSTISASSTSSDLRRQIFMRGMSKDVMDSPDGLPTLSHQTSIISASSASSTCSGLPSLNLVRELSKRDDGSTRRLLGFATEAAMTIQKIAKLMTVKGYNTIFDQTYKLVEKLVTWTQANSFCLKSHGQLLLAGDFSRKLIQSLPVTDKSATESTSGGVSFWTRNSSEICGTRESSLSTRGLRVSVGEGGKIIEEYVDGDQKSSILCKFGKQNPFCKNAPPNALFSTRSSKVYQFGFFKLSYTDANTKCASRGGVLANLKTIQETLLTFCDSCDNEFALWYGPEDEEVTESGYDTQTSVDSSVEAQCTLVRFDRIGIKVRTDFNPCYQPASFLCEYDFKSIWGLPVSLQPVGMISHTPYILQRIQGNHTWIEAKTACSNLLGKLISRQTATDKKFVEKWNLEPGESMKLWISDENSPCDKTGSKIILNPQKMATVLSDSEKRSLCKGQNNADKIIDEWGNLLQDPRSEISRIKNQYVILNPDGTKEEQVSCGRKDIAVLCEYNTKILCGEGSPDKSFSFNGKRYELFKAGVIWSKAFDLCRNRYGQLVSDSAITKDFILSMELKSQLSVWTSAYGKRESMYSCAGTSPNRLASLGGLTSEVRQRNQHQAVTLGSKGLQKIAGAQGREKNAVICQFDLLHHVWDNSARYHVREYCGKFYQFGMKKVTWSEAFLECMEHGGSLAALYNNLLKQIYPKFSCGRDGEKRTFWVSTESDVAVALTMNDLSNTWSSLQVHKLNDKPCYVYNVESGVLEENKNCQHKNVFLCQFDAYPETRT